MKKKAVEKPVQQKYAVHRKNNPLVKAIKEMNWTPEKVERFNNLKVQKELTSELDKKIRDGHIAQRAQEIQDEWFAKMGYVRGESALHHLKQLKVEIGKRVAKYKNTKVEGSYQDGLRAVSLMIDKKIAKLK